MTAATTACSGTRCKPRVGLVSRPSCDQRFSRNQTVRNTQPLVALTKADWSNGSLSR